MFQLLDPIAIVEQRKEYNFDYRNIKAEEPLCYPEFSTPWIHCHWYNNTKQKDGRINSGYDANGRLTAITVSPHSETFWENIEPRVTPIIKELLRLGYMPFSSCDGHGEYSARLVYLAFDSIEKRKSAEKAFRKLIWFIPGVVTENTGIPFNIKITGKTIVKTDYRNVKSEEAARYFNTVFHKNSKDWHCMKLLIFRDNKDRLKRRFLKEPVTDYLVNRLSKGYLPKYREL